MSEIHAYRQIVQLQVEIVRLSQKNADLEARCKQVQEELISEHQKQTARRSATRALRDYLTDRNIAARNNLPGMIRSANLRPILQRVWQSVL